MKLTAEENQFIESIHATSGVPKDYIEKVFESFITLALLKMYDAVDNREPGALIINEQITFTIPHFAEVTVNINDEPATPDEIVKYKKESGGFIPRVRISAKPSEFLCEDIRKVGKDETTHIEERIKLQIFESLNSKRIKR